jgi:hypothetical protein
MQKQRNRNEAGDGIVIAKFPTLLFIVNQYFPAALSIDWWRAERGKSIHWLQPH